MSSDFVLLILTALATAYGFWASLQGAPKSWTARSAAIIFLAVGVHTTLAITVAGAGEILPGHQLNPAVQGYWAQLIEDGDMLAPRPEYMLAALLATFLAIGARPTRTTAYRILPATVVFLGIFFAVRTTEPIRFERAVSHEAGATAYLTVIGSGEDARLLFAVDADEQVFLPVLHEHEGAPPPPSPNLWWSADGLVVTFGTQSGKPFFGIDLEGQPTGWLPESGDPWPDRNWRKTDPVRYQRDVSAARVEIARLLDQHGGPARE